MYYSYLRAADPAAADFDLSDVDGVETKGIDSAVVLGKLVAAVRDEPWSTSTVHGKLVHPVSQSDPSYDTGPWIEQLDDATRDTLAGITDVADAAARWGFIEELDVAGTDLLPVLTELRDLAVRARAAGQHLYCMNSL